MRKYCKTSGNVKGRREDGAVEVNVVRLLEMGLSYSR